MTLASSPGRERRSLQECSACALRLVFGLALDRAAAATALAEVSPEDRPALLSNVAVLRRLVRCVREEAGVASKVGHILDAHLKSEVRLFEECSPCDLAELWAATRQWLRGRSLAALLLTIARGRDPIFRALEARLVEEIELEAIGSLVASPALIPPRAGAPATPHNHIGEDEDGYELFPCW